ncbi:MAG: DUF1045 domain-containing protein [Rubricella sp.]
MVVDKRYAVYFMPPAGSALQRFGAHWLGWDADRAAHEPHPDAPFDVAALTRTPRKYGFHATLKPPFRLQPGASTGGIDRALRTIAARHAGFVLAPVQVAAIGPFLALVPEDGDPALQALADDLVTALDTFRAPLTEAEIARRKPDTLSERQRANLAAWGYPFVLEEFRFHMTLTGPIRNGSEREAVRTWLETRLQAVTGGTLAIGEIALCGEGEDGLFRVRHRYPLTG